MAESPRRAAPPPGAGPDQDSVAADRLGDLISDAGEGLALGGIEEEAGETYSAESAAIVNLANQILIQAVGEGASDIHIEPFEKQFQVRYRLDGALYRRAGLSPGLKNALLARLKIMAKLDPAEGRAPQEGRIRMRVGQEKEIDFRVSSLPTLFGESVVLRLLEKSGPNFDLGRLGLTRKNLDRLRSAIHRPGGLLLVAGPAGSGKTTTLHACLSLRNTDEVKILTAEDPVEFSVPGLNQVSVAPETGLTFAKALRAFPRQDPDICLIGEIRDQETAELAVEAALTGRLVLAGLHAGDAPSAVTRLLALGANSFNLSAALLLCSAQRLLRRLCPHCKTAAEPPPADRLIEAGLAPGLAGAVQLYEGRGCPECRGSGYLGRLGVFEIMEITDTLAEAIAAKAPESQIRRIAIQEGLSTLRQDGLLKASQGLTTLAQVLEKIGPPRAGPPRRLFLNPDDRLFEAARFNLPASSAALKAAPGLGGAPACRDLAEADPMAPLLNASEAPRARELRSA